MAYNGNHGYSDYPTNNYSGGYGTGAGGGARDPFADQQSPYGSNAAQSQPALYPPQPYDYRHQSVDSFDEGDVPTASATAGASAREKGDPYSAQYGGAGGGSSRKKWWIIGAVVLVIVIAA